MKFIYRYQCPVCMLITDSKVFVKRQLLDPAELGHIITAECRGKKGLPVVSREAFINHSENYPEVLDRLKDVCLGLIHAFYNHDFIDDGDLPNFNELDERDEEITDLKEKIENLEFDLENFEDNISNLKNQIDERDEEIENLKEELDLDFETQN